MPDSKKKLCPRRGCGKDFEDDGQIEKTPCCSFPIRAFEIRSEIEDAFAFRREQDEEEKKKKAVKDAPAKKPGSTLGNLGGLF